MNFQQQLLDSLTGPLEIDRLIGNKVRLQRTSRVISVAAAAQACGRDERSYISGETAEVPFTEHELVDLSILFGMSVGALYPHDSTLHELTDVGECADTVMELVRGYFAIRNVENRRALLASARALRT